MTHGFILITSLETPTSERGHILRSWGRDPSTRLSGDAAQPLAGTSRSSPPAPRGFQWPLNRVIGACGPRALASPPPAHKASLGAGPPEAQRRLRSGAPSFPPREPAWRGRALLWTRGADSGSPAAEAAAASSWTGMPHGPAPAGGPRPPLLAGGSLLLQRNTSPSPAFVQGSAWSLLLL